MLFVNVQFRHKNNWIIVRKRSIFGFKYSVSGYYSSRNSRDVSVKTNHFWCHYPGRKSSDVSIHDNHIQHHYHGGNTEMSQ